MREREEKDNLTTEIMTKWDEYTNTSRKDMHTNVSIASTLESTVATTKKSDIGTRLFIHVGPVKTGSSSVQCNLQVNPFLKDSSYDFMGRMERPSICPQTNHRKTKHKFWDMQEFVYRYVLRGWLKQDQFQGYVTRFKAYLQSNADNAINTIISAEEFCGLRQLDPPNSDNDDRMQLLANLLNSIPQSITFQVFHRYHFDWALSRYKSGETNNHQSLNKDPMRSILDREDIFIKGDTGMGDDCSPMSMWRFLQDKLIPLLDKGSVESFNFHGDNLVTRYICNLPEAQAACEKSRTSLHMETARPTNTDILHSDRIAKGAWTKVMYTNTSAARYQRKKIGEIIVDHVRNNLNLLFAELPLECLPKDVLSESLALSIRIGREMLGDESDVESLHSKFSRKKSENKFCSVNVTAVLEDPGWKQFFRDLDVGV